MSTRPAIPAEIEREILIESGHRCAVCGASIPLERAHIIPWHKSREHKAEDLICLCASCHERADKEDWGEKILREYKRRPWVIRQYEKADDIPEPRATLPISPLPITLHQLRAPVPTFTGRTRDLKQITAHLTPDEGGVALIAGLAGMGGIGKTELAYAVAARLQEHYPDAQLVVELRGTTEPTTPQAALSQVIHAFAPEAPPSDALEALRGLYCSLLRGKRVLLLLDDAADVGQVSPLLGAPPGVGILVTSRHRLALSGLRRWDVDLLSLGVAVKLLRKTAPSRKDVDQATWERIGELCGMLPLALRVAGATLETTPDLDGTTYATDLADEKRRLAALRLEGDPKGDVGAVLGLSVARLESEHPERAARWTLLGLLPLAPFDASLAAALWGHAAEGEGDLPRVVVLEEEETQETLHTLVRRNLLDWDRKTRRYSLHDLLRLYARGRAQEQLDAEELEAAQLRHGIYVLEVARLSSKRYLAGGDDLLAGLSLLDDHLPHLRAAFAWAREGAAAARVAQAALAVLLPDAAVHPLNLRLVPQEKIEWLEVAAAAAHTLGHPQAAGSHLCNLGSAYADLGEMRRAIEYYEQALKIAREVEGRGGEGTALGNLGIAYAALGEVRRAIEYHEQALKIHREIGDRRGEGAVLGNLGLAYADLGEVPRAMEYYEQALKIAREVGDRPAEGAWLGDLGLAYYRLGEMRRAIEYHDQALEIAREIGDRQREGNHLGSLGIAYYSLGEVRRAMQYHEQALEIHRKIVDRRGEANHLGNLGIAYADLGEVPRAMEYHEQALAIRREIGDRRGEGNDLDNLGTAYKNLGDLVRARELWEQALRIFEDIEDPYAERVRGLLDGLAGGK